jgi:hypothetical protein
MAIPAVPLPVLMMLVVAVTCPEPLFSAARNAALPAILAGDRFSVGMSILNTTDYLSQMAGFTLGGVLVTVLGGPHMALVIDAATYLISAGLVQWGIGPHRPGASEHGRATRAWSGAAAIKILMRDRRLAGLVGLVWLYGFYLAPAALAAPFAREMGAGNAAVGILMAADLPGSVIGALLVIRIPPAFRHRLMVPLAISTGLPLLATAMVPPLPVTIFLWTVSGALSTGYLLLAKVAFTRAVPDAIRARAIGVAAAGLQTTQGLGALLAGAIAGVIRPSASIAACAALGVCGAVIITLVCRPDAASP